MLITFQILLFLIMLFAGVSAVDQKQTDEYRLKSFCLSLATIATLFLTFMLL